MSSTFSTFWDASEGKKKLKKSKRVRFNPYQYEKPKRALFDEGPDSADESSSSQSISTTRWKRSLRSYKSVSSSSSSIAPMDVQSSATNSQPSRTILPPLEATKKECLEETREQLRSSIKQRLDKFKSSRNVSDTTTLLNDSQYDDVSDDDAYVELSDINEEYSDEFDEYDEENDDM